MSADWGTPITPEEPKKNNKTIIVVAVVVVVVLLCCCCVAVGVAWTYGDQIMSALNF